ncbi:hypothetical protein GCM10011428_34830 [Streptomyces violaceus]
MSYAKQALLGALLSEPQRLTNVTGSGPDAFSTPGHAAVSAGIRALSAPDPAETTDHAAVFALRTRSPPWPGRSYRTQRLARQGAPDGSRGAPPYHSLSHSCHQLDGLSRT